MSTTISIARPQLRKAYRTFCDLLGPDGAHPRPGPRWVRRALTKQPSRLPPLDCAHPFWAAVLNFAPATGGGEGEAAPGLPPDRPPDLRRAIALYAGALIVGRINPAFGPDERRAFARALKGIKAALRPPPSPEAIRISLALLRIRQPPRPRVQPLPRVMAPARPREAPSRGPAPPTGPPEGDSEEGEGDSDGESDPPPSPVRPRRSRSRGRPRKARRFRAFPEGRTYRARLRKLDAVAAALEGRGDAVFATLTPPSPPDDRDRRLAAVPVEIARAFAALAARLRRDGAAYAMVVATRAGNGALFPHAHLLVGGVSLARLRVLAARSGLAVAYAEPVRDPKAAARYMAGASQKRPYDGILGCRGFYQNLLEAPAPEAKAANLAGKEAPTGVSPRNASHPEPALPAPEAIPPGLELVPGVRIADVPTFLAALAQDLESRLPAVRGAARHRLALLLAALAERGPP